MQTVIKRLKMGNTFVDAQIDNGKKEDCSLFCLNNDSELAEDFSLEFSESKSKRLVEKLKPEQDLTSNINDSQTSDRCIEESFLRRRHSVDLRILKHILHLDEKYIQQCLDLVQIRASNYPSIDCFSAAPCNISVNLRSPKMEVLFEGWKSPRRGNTCDLGRILIECPSAAGPGNVFICPVRPWIVGTITGSDDVRDFLKSPVVHHLGALDSDVNLGRTKSSDFRSSPSGPSISSSPKLGKATLSLRDQRYGSETLHKRLASISSTNSACSDQFSSSACTTVSLGMLHCSWMSGIPHFVFSVDDRNEVYVAKPWTVDPSDEKALDYMYVFHSRKGGHKEHVICDNVSDIVGKMKVSTSFTLCSNNSKLMETEFVMFGTDENHYGEMLSSTPTLGKNQRLSKKVVELLRTNYPLKHKTTPKFGGPSAIFENSSWRACQNNKVDGLGRSSFLSSHPPPNLELAAIVVKNYVHDNCQEALVGGWGLKFLRKTGVEYTNTSLEASISPESFQESSLRNRSDCSTSMNVLVPAGLHGGPRTRNGGPSSLTERWRSGGHCDCGGWDIGCPLTVLNNRSSKEVSPQGDPQGECKSFDLCIQGVEKGNPTLKVVNIHDGLYSIHFQSTLSALQSFSIAVAIIHTQFPELRPKNVQKLKQQESGMKFMYLLHPANRYENIVPDLAILH
ncbi:hypothetical protein HHK36_012927 [Tetracentron sinense]|uniref:Uncharacterized protein n=1 Tax=Tetracentron sinense TaxID=13715 RepID=A0A834ZDS3_TETSI|nr:hypothetical protein HHK36_012927 [Tetracentron sinense]